MSDAPLYDVTIVGAGICGLTLSYHLQKVGYKILLLEANTQAGGVINSNMLDNFLLESGPNSTFAKDVLTELIKDLGLDDQVLYPQDFAKKRFLARKNKYTNNLQLTAVPRSLFQAVSSPILSFSGKLRLLLEPLVNCKTLEDQDVKSFMSDHFGVEFTEQVIAAMLGGIWAADISQLSTRSALPSIWDLATQGSILYHGVKKLLTTNQAKSRPKILSFKQGMFQLVQALVQKLDPDTIQLNSQVTELSLAPDYTKVVTAQTNLDQSTREFQTKFLVLTTSTEVTANLLKKFNPNLTTQIQKIPYAPVGLLHLAYKTSEVSHPLDGFGFLVPPNLNLALLGAIFSSSLFANRSPTGHHLLTCFVGGATKPELADVTNENILNRVITELNTLIGSKAQPTVLKQTFLPSAIPNCPVGHYQLQNQLKDFQTNYPNVFVTGNWLKGISVVERLAVAKNLALEILGKL